MPEHRLDVAIADGAQSGAPQPALAQPESSPQPSRRYLSIDILRALAILFMIEVHAVDHFADAYEYPQSVFNAAQVFGHISAPLFALLSGLSYWLWLDAQKRSAHSTDDIIKYSLRRGMFVFILGFAVNLFIWLPAQTFDWDILALIGASALLLVAMRNWHPGVLVAICIVILIVSPPLRDLVDYNGYWVDEEFTYDLNMPDVVFGFLLTGYFPLLPWLVFPLLGFALGRLFYRDDNRAALPLSLPLIGTIMFAAALAGALLEPYVPAGPAKYYASGWPTGFYPGTTVFIVGSLGGAFIWLWIMNRMVDLNPRVSGTGVVLTFFRRYSYFALTAYVAHLVIQLWPLWILAWWQGKSPTNIYLGRVMNADTALWSALALIIVLYLYFIFLDRHRKYSLEHFMRWISS